MTVLFKKRASVGGCKKIVSRVARTHVLTIKALYVGNRLRLAQVVFQCALLNVVRARQARW